MSTPWWRSAVVYQVYVRSFADSSGTGIGDLEGIRSRLPYLADLGVDGVWMTPFYPSPMADHGYDVADPRAVEPLFGDLAGFDALVADAHALGLKVLADVVPNHTSDQRDWFQAALAAGPGSPERARYLFREGRGEHGEQAPNGWQSVFGGPAWQRVTEADGEPGQWYLHLFAPEQPDLDWRHPEVRADAEQTLRFWLDRGVDGFRIDVAHGLLKDPDLGEAPGEPMPPEVYGVGPEVATMWDHPDVHEVYRSWRRLVETYPGDRVLVGEVWVRDGERQAAYTRPDELHLTFGFRLLVADWDAAAWRTEIEGLQRDSEAVGARPGWVLGNHDVERAASRYAAAEDDPEQPERGTARSRAAHLALLALPGPLFLYSGDELGLPDVAIAPEQRQDPIWERSGHTRPGRDGCRVPMPWAGSAPPFGFSAALSTWLPQPVEWARLSVEEQAGDPLSTLVLIRGALAIRAALPSLGAGAPFAWADAPEGCVAWVRGGSASVLCVVNLGETDAQVAVRGQLLLASAPVSYDAELLHLPRDATAWLVQADQL